MNMKNMKEEKKKLIEFYIDKSIQSFLLCIEVFNKPTVDYRLEGAVFFLCNAWELLLKAKLMKDDKSIYYKNKEKSNHTLSLMDSATKIMTNVKDPVIVNLKIIVEFRNMATHSIIPQHEIIYLPFLTSCVKSYSEKLYDFFEINISDYIKTNFLSLFINNKTIDSQQILTKYGEGIFDLFEKKKSELLQVIDENVPGVAIRIDANLVRVSNRENADLAYYLTNNPNDQNVRYIEKNKDYNISHPLRRNDIVQEINRIIRESNIQFTPIRIPEKENKQLYSTTCFDLMVKHFKLKEDLNYCYKIINGKQIIYKYSPSLITRLITEIQADANIVIKIKNKD